MSCTLALGTLSALVMAIASLALAPDGALIIADAGFLANASAVAYPRPGSAPVTKNALLDGFARASGVKPVGFDGHTDGTNMLSIYEERLVGHFGGGRNAGLQPSSRAHCSQRPVGIPERQRVHTFSNGRFKTGPGVGQSSGFEVSGRVHRRNQRPRSRRAFSVQAHRASASLSSVATSLKFVDWRASGSKY